MVAKFTGGTIRISNVSNIIAAPAGPNPKSAADAATASTDKSSQTPTVQGDICIGPIGYLNGYISQPPIGWEHIRRSHRGIGLHKALAPARSRNAIHNSRSRGRKDPGRTRCSCSNLSLCFLCWTRSRNGGGYTEWRSPISYRIRLMRGISSPRLTFKSLKWGDQCLEARNLPAGFGRNAQSHFGVLTSLLI